jgi:hypothetical protein
MKKLAAILCLTALTTGAFGQGLVKFANSSTSLVSFNGAVMPASATPGYYFALLSAPLGTTDPTLFAFAGVYATNSTSAAGRLQGGSLLGVTTDSTWAPATTRAFLVAGWSADNGNVWNPNWMHAGTIGGVAGTPGGYFGFSSIAEGRAGGTDPVTQQNYPALALFSGTTIAAGFNLVPVPEPTTMALAGLGAAALLIFRRRK